jgi:S-DNA-T family DNA segregation ATPase FtsK/SpoIIIE
VAKDTTETKPISTIEDAVESIVAPSEEPTEEVLEAQETEEAIDEVEATAEDEIEEVEEEEEVEEIEASDSDDEDLIEEPSQEEPELYDVKVDGQERQVTLNDLKQGYSGQEYVQQGMQEVAAQKKEAEAVYTALINERQEMAELYQQLQQNGMQSAPVKPTKEMFESDPIGYMQKNIEYEEQMSSYNNQMAQLQQVSQQNSEASQKAHDAYVQEQMQILQKDIPIFADEKKGQQLKDRLVKTGKNHYGYSHNEIEQITDARAIKVLLDAQRYQDIISGKTKAKVKTKSAKPVVRPGAKKTATPTAKVRSRQQAKLRETGNIDDAINLIMQT